MLCVIVIISKYVYKVYFICIYFSLRFSYFIKSS